MADFLEGAFWTSSKSEDLVPLDPLGLDSMREQLSDILVPFLTGRTTSILDAFWTMVFLRWGSYDGGPDNSVSQVFLEWERMLKLVWVHYPTLKPPGSFPGINQARLQACEPDSPNFRYRPLLQNQRSQGLLGAYLRPLRKLELVRNDRLALTDAGLLWTKAAEDIPKIRNGDWTSWKSGFDSTARTGIKSFTDNLCARLRDKMPALYHSLAALGWPQKERWDRAADRLGDLAPYAQLAHAFRPWADKVRQIFDELVFEEKRRIPEWPRLRAEVPPRLNDDRWQRIRAVSKAARVGVDFLATWHKEEYLSRGRGSDQLWLASWGDVWESRPENGNTLSPAGDFRWSSARNMLKPTT